MTDSVIIKNENKNTIDIDASVDITDEPIESAIPLLLNDNIVADYLLKHDDFFINNAHLLTKIRLPHASGNTTSLVEKQLEVLRHKNQATHAQLQQLLAHAQDNQSLFEKSSQLVITLLTANSLNEVIEVCETQLEQTFGVDVCHISLFKEPAASDDIIHSHSSLKWLSLNDVQSQLSMITSYVDTFCGILREDEKTLAFGENNDGIASCAISYIFSDSMTQPIGLLALGSNESDTYQSNTGTLFLNYISDVLAHLLPDYLQPSA